MRQKIPYNISTDHILLALNELDNKGIPEEHQSTKFDLSYKGKNYPPKYVLRTANIFANGEPFETELFSGGDEANTYLKKLGFTIKQKTNVWIFQANPKIYDIENELNDNKISEGTWLVTRYKNQISIGNIGLIWKAGEKRGIYAITEILSSPKDMADLDNDALYWKNKEDAKSLRTRVKYRYNLKLDPPLLEKEIKTINGLHNLSILKNHIGTNFRVTYEEWRILSDIFEKRYGYILEDSKNAFSWTIKNSNVAVKKMDKSSFIHHGTGIPIEIRNYFELNDIMKGYQCPVNLVYQNKIFQAVISADNQPNPRTRLMWHEEFAKVIRNIMPLWYDHFSSNGDPSSISPEMRFIKTGQPKEYKIEFIDPKDATEVLTIAEEIQENEIVKLPEGAKKQITVNAYERNPKARELCIKNYGYRCSVCEFDFEEVYGKIGIGFIHVHHLKPLSEINEEYQVDPINDLRPVCPNCHSMLHKAIFSIEQLRNTLGKNQETINHIRK